MPLPEEFLLRLKEQNRIEDVMRSYVSLKRTGRNLKCLCPFHSEKTPSCTVYSDNDSFYCFGCGAGGDVITFIMKIENLDYIDAVKFLADRVGMPMPEDGYDDRAAREKKRLGEINRAAAKYFYANLRTPDGKEGLKYLIEKRNLSVDTIKRFGLGVAPNHWTGLKNALTAQGFSERELIAASLLSEKNGRTYDFFVNRVIFPIFDLRGNVIAFSGRTLEPNPQGMKYLNSRETPLYKKSRTLFALNFAKNISVKTKRLILCEGNVDVISLHQAGFPEAVATCGTAITGEHARLMAQYCDEVYICYDSDEAGRKATKSAIQIITSAGLVAKVVNVSGDGIKDVDDYLKRYGGARFKLLLEGSEGSTDYELSSAKTGIDLSSDLGKIEYLKRAVNVLAGIENRIEREVYIFRVAADQEVSKVSLEAEVAAAIKKQRSQEKKRERNLLSPAPVRDDINPDAVKYPKQSRAEQGVIAYLFRHPESVQEIFNVLPPENIITSFHRKIYESLKNLADNGHEIALGALGGEFSADEMGRISSIIARSREITIDKATLNDYIQLLNAGINTAKPEDGSDDDFREFYSKLSGSK